METLVAEQPIKLDLQNIPTHIALIPDGNRRWAKNKGVSPMIGHWHGAEALIKIIESASSLGVQFLTVYAFSTENWSRSLEEVDSLMSLLQAYLVGQKNRMVKEGVRLGTIGDISRLPQRVQKALEEVKDATCEGKKIDLILAINYGARDDIRRATSAIVDDCLRGKIRKDDITEKLISNYLDTAPWPDPQLLIRTSGEMRLSNFLLWQVSYGELYSTNVLWPDFGEDELIKAIESYQKRERRIGC